MSALRTFLTVSIILKHFSVNVKVITKKTFIICIQFVTFLIFIELLSLMKESKRILKYYTE